MSQLAIANSARGDVRHSQADITKARRFLGYEPTHLIEDGLDEAFSWYLATTCPATQAVTI